MTDIHDSELAPARGRRRVNMAECSTETWRPPLFGPAITRMQRFMAAVRRFVDLQAGSIWNDLKPELATVQGTLVDVGCGAQPYRSLVNTNARYVGLDIAEAKDRFGYEVPDTTYFTGDTWPIDSATIDAILCTETLEHVCEPMLLLEEAARCLRPNGRLILTVPFAARWHFVPHDYWRYTPSSLKSLLERAGFRDVVVYARGNALTVACYKNMALVLEPLLSPKRDARALAARILSLPFIPLVLMLALVGNLSLRSASGHDCLGYSVLANRCC